VLLTTPRPSGQGTATPEPLANTARGSEEGALPSKGHASVKRAPWRAEERTMMRRRSSKRKGGGTLTFMVLICLMSILGVLAVTLDGGMLSDIKRRVQAAADAAALAAANDLYNNYGTNSGTDPSGTAATSARSTASANGFSNDGVTSVVTVNVPPTSGSFTG